jgi:DNA-binding transcriptional LysR family regulator
MAEQIAGLRDYSIDVGFLRGPVNEPDITSEVVFRENIAVVLPPGHPLARMKRLPMRMLDDLPAVTITRRGFQPIRDVVAALCEQSGIRVRSVQEADSTFTHLEMVAAGLGYALLPEFVQSVLPRGVVQRPLDFAHVPSICMVAAYRKDDDVPAVQNLMGVVRQCFKRDPK